MSPFASYKPIWLNEADGDQNAQAAGANQQPDAATTQTTQTTTQQIQQPQQAPQVPNDNGGDVNVNINGGGGQPTAAGYDDGTGGDDQAADMGDQQAVPNETDNPAKEIDRQLFDTLSPQEQKIKTLKLRELYSILYDNIDQVIKKYDTLGIKFEEYSEPIMKSLNTLYDLKDMIATYMNYLFDSKTYVENDIMFNRYLTVLNTIKNATDELCDIKSDEIKQAQNPTK